MCAVDAARDLADEAVCDAATCHGAASVRRARKHDGRVPRGCAHRGTADAHVCSMTAYPVRYFVERPARFTRLQLLVRVVAFCALGVLGLTFGTVFLFGYLALPVFAAAR